MTLFESVYQTRLIEQHAKKNRKVYHGGPAGLTKFIPMDNWYRGPDKWAVPATFFSYSKLFVETWAIFEKKKDSDKNEIYTCRITKDLSLFNANAWSERKAFLKYFKSIYNENYEYEPQERNEKHNHVAGYVKKIPYTWDFELDDENKYLRTYIKENPHKVLSPHISKSQRSRIFHAVNPNSFDNSDFHSLEGGVVPYLLYHWKKPDGSHKYDGFVVTETVTNTYMPSSKMGVKGNNFALFRPMDCIKIESHEKISTDEGRYFPTGASEKEYFNDAVDQIEKEVSFGPYMVSLNILDEWQNDIRYENRFNELVDIFEEKIIEEAAKHVKETGDIGDWYDIIMDLENSEYVCGGDVNAVLDEIEKRAKRLD